MAIRGVFFDLYGTLLEYGDIQAAWRDWLDTFHHCLCESGLRLSKEEFAPTCEGFFSREHRATSGDELTVYESRIKAHCDGLGLDISVPQIQQAAMLSVAAWGEHVTLDPEAIPVLQALGRHMTLALISNYDHPPHAHALLLDLGLREHFRAVVISGAVGVKKPDPAIFDIALRGTGLRAEEVAFVGDSSEDVEVALAVGAMPILIARPTRHGGNPNDFELDRPPADAAPAAGGQNVRTISRLHDLLEMCL